MHIILTGRSALTGTESFSDVFLVVASVVSDGARREIDRVADDARAPGGFQELGERAVAGLIGSRRRNRPLWIERRHIRDAHAVSVTPVEVRTTR